MKKLKAAVLNEYNQPFEIEEVEQEELEKGFVAIEVRASGICGGDLHRYTGGIEVNPLPSIIGHQVTGVVHEVGEGVSKDWIGRRVGVSPISHCGNCHNCLAGKSNLCLSDHRWNIVSGFYGGYAEYVNVPKSCLVEIPENIPFSEAACLVDAFATVYHAVDLAGIRLGETAVIYGAGDLGTAAIQLAKLSGAKIISVDVKDHKLEVAKKLGAWETINANDEDPVDKIQELTNGLGADIAFEIAGSEKTTLQALDSTGVGGRIVLVGATDNPIDGFKTMPYAKDGFGIMTQKKLLASSAFTMADIEACVSLREHGLIDTKTGLKELKFQNINDGFKGKIEGNYSRAILVT